MVSSPLTAHQVRHIYIHGFIPSYCPLAIAVEPIDEITVNGSTRPQAVGSGLWIVPCRNMLFQIINTINRSTTVIWNIIPLNIRHTKPVDLVILIPVISESVAWVVLSTENRSHLQYSLVEFHLLQCLSTLTKHSLIHLSNLYQNSSRVCLWVIACQAQALELLKSRIVPLLYHLPLCSYLPTIKVAHWQAWWHFGKATVETNEELS